ncbi:MAG: hypothetical protein BMS9Abin26_0003 [Gammaproteobacteria bacterium]|nr:MAG: hypothetical protein BMS9Abin26_0003 [Gammaproteobacteria bacterium]
MFCEFRARGFIILLGLSMLLSATLQANSLNGNGLSDRYYIEPIIGPYPEHVLQHYQRSDGDYPHSDNRLAGINRYRLPGGSPAYFAETARGTGPVQPAATHTTVQTPLQHSQQITGDHLLFVDQPRVDTAQLMADVRKLQQALARRKDDLQFSASEKEFTAKDALITALLPGGILYGLIRKSQIENIKQQLVDVETELVDVDDAVVALQQLVGNVMLAQASEPLTDSATNPALQLSEPIANSATLVTLPLSSSSVISHSPAGYPSSYDTLLQSAW